MKKLSEAREKLIEMVKQAEERGKARFVLAITALLHLTDPHKYLTKRDLLSPLPDYPEKPSRALQKEISSKSWQREFLAQLMEMDLIDEERGPVALLYRSRTEERVHRIAEIISNAIFGDGVRLKAILWPADYTTPMNPSEEDVSENGVVSIPPETAQDPAIDTIRELTEQLSQVAGHLENIYGGIYGVEQRMGENVKAFDGLKTILGERIDQIDQRINRLEKLSGKFDAVLKAIENEERAKLMSMAEKLLEIKTRNNSLVNQKESEDRRLEKLVEEIKQYLQRS